MNANKDAQMFDDSEIAHQQLNQIIAEIRAVLAIDLREFPIRAAKKRYLALPEFAATITSDSLSKLKSELKEAAETKASEIIQTLSEFDIWVEGISPPGNKAAKTLRDNRKVSEALRGIAETTREVLESYGFPEALLDIHYDPPTWFIDGKYLPGLIEKYWKALASLRNLAREHKRAQHEQEVQVLAERWEDA